LVFLLLDFILHFLSMSLSHRSWVEALFLPIILYFSNDSGFSPYCTHGRRPFLLNHVSKCAPLLSLIFLIFSWLYYIWFHSFPSVSHNKLLSEPLSWSVETSTCLQSSSILKSSMVSLIFSHWLIRMNTTFTQQYFMKWFLVKVRSQSIWKRETRRSWMKEP